jgi:hypothetical protein
MPVPAQEDRHPRRHSNSVHFSPHRRQDGYQAPTAEDRAVQRAVAVLKEHGYGIAARCLDCQHPITSAVSLARMRGPRCAARAGDAK